jgi:hypothetical protein
MAELSTIMALMGHNDLTIAWAAQRALDIVQKRQVGQISPDQAVQALIELIQQTDWSISESNMDDKALIDDAIEHLIAVVSA